MANTQLNTTRQLLALLTSEFTTTCTVKDVRHIRFKPISAKTLVMWDVDYHLGNMWVDNITEKRCRAFRCTKAGLIRFLLTHGAKRCTKHPYSDHKPTPPLYD